jgi:Atg22-like efflux protein
VKKKKKIPANIHTNTNKPYSYIVTLVTIIQANQVSFSFLQITYLGIVQAVTSIASTFGFWYFQKYYKIRTKPMFLVTNFFSIVIPLWGMLGLWTQEIGYRRSVSFPQKGTFLL